MLDKSKTFSESCNLCILVELLSLYEQQFFCSFLITYKDYNEFEKRYWSKEHLHCIIRVYSRVEYPSSAVVRSYSCKTS